MRYLSRDLQRQIAGLVLDATTGMPGVVKDDFVTRMANAIESNNGSPALAFLNRIDSERNPVDTAEAQR